MYQRPTNLFISCKFIKVMTETSFNWKIMEASRSMKLNWHHDTKINDIHHNNTANKDQQNTWHKQQLALRTSAYDNKSLVMQC